MSIKRLILTASMSSVLAACAVGPDYHVPDSAVAAAFKGVPVNSEQWIEVKPSQAWIRGDWWTDFNDAELNQLIFILNQENQTVAQALARYQAAIAQTRGSRAGLFPSLDSTTSANRSGGSESDVLSRYSLGADVSWEADLWGRIRRQVEASSASEEAAAINLADARLSMQAELLQNYFSLRSTDLERQLLRQIISAYEQSLQITRNRYEQGVAAYADVVAAEAQLENARVDAISIETTRSTHENAIAVLIGQTPSTFSLAEKPNYLPEPISVPVGLPSELLRARPDIAAAERNVAAANANIGVAQSAWFPRLNLSASGNSTALNCSALPKARPPDTITLA